MKIYEAQEVSKLASKKAEELKKEIGFTDKQADLAYKIAFGNTKDKNVVVEQKPLPPGLEYSERKGGAITLTTVVILKYVFGKEVDVFSVIRMAKYMLIANKTNNPNAYIFTGDESDLDTESLVNADREQKTLYMVKNNWAGKDDAVYKFVTDFDITRIDDGMLDLKELKESIKEMKA